MEGHENDLPPSEAARARRRDRDLDAHARAGMRTGLAKQFKQVLDAQVKRAEEAEQAEREGGTRSQDAGEPGTTPRRKRRSS
jgi:hypothetical protein